MSAHGTYFNDVGFPALTESFFGDAATYSPASGPDVPCFVVLTHDVVIQPISYESTTVKTGTVLEPISTVVEAVVAGETFTMAGSGVVYTAVKELEDNGGVSKWVVK